MTSGSWLASDVRNDLVSTELRVNGLPMSILALRDTRSAVFSETIMQEDGSYIWQSSSQLAVSSSPLLETEIIELEQDKTLSESTSFGFRFFTEGGKASRQVLCMKLFSSDRLAWALRKVCTELFNDSK